jgi:hypothetical protein
VEVDVLIFHALPQPFDKYIVDPAPLAIHADLDLLGFENLGEVLAGELGEFNPSSQHLLTGGCDGYKEAAF